MLFGIPSLQAQWLEDGVAICTSAGQQELPRLISDGAGGAIITWYDDRGGPENIYAQRIDASGAVKWTADGIVICDGASYQLYPRIASDGSGGAIITWEYYQGYGSGIFAQRIDADGMKQWHEGGIGICVTELSQTKPQIISDGTGGAIITWEDRRSGSDSDIYAQRIDASGSVQWTVGGVAICTATEDQAHPQLTSNGAGGAIITWEDFRTTGGPDVYAQSIDSNGAVQWTADGIIICEIAPNAGGKPQLISDNGGGAIITWEYYYSETCNYYYIYAQRVDASGNTQWTSNGVAICTTSGDQRNPKIILGGAGNAIITWEDHRSPGSGIYAQNVDAGGAARWKADGAAICAAAGSQYYPEIASDNAGGAIITWQDYRNGNNDIYVQAINASGIDQWTSNGIAICAAAEDQTYPQITPDGASGAIITWQDYRNGNSDIYAQRIGVWGVTVSPWVSFPVTTAGDTSETTLFICNRFKEPLTLKESSGIEGPFFFRSSFKDSLMEGITIEADSFIGTEVYFAPLEGGIQGNRVYFEDFHTGDTLASTEFEGEGRALSFEWTTTHLYPDRQVSIDDDLIIEETMDDYVKVDSLVLYFFKGGSSVYENMKFALSHEDPLNDRYLVSIPASSGGSRGLNFYVAAFNGAAVAYNPSPGSPERFRIKIDNLEFAAPQPASKYKMISFPIDIPNNTIVGVLHDDLGGYEATKWRMFTYNPSFIPIFSLYEEIPNENITSIEQGRAYWLITREAVTLDTSPKQAISTPTDSSFVLILEPGWNMIGNPFNFDVAWDSVLVNGIYTFNQTVVDDPVWWNPSHEDYDFDVDVLEPFEGYWVKNPQNFDIALEVRPADASTVLSLHASGDTYRPSGDAERDGWRIRIGASSAGSRDRYNFAGIESGAKTCWDSHDRAEPPPCPGQSISLYFPHTSWEPYPGLYSADIRGEHETREVGKPGFTEFKGMLWGNMWLFDIHKNFSQDTAGDEVLFEFEGLANVHCEAVVYLVDRHLEKLIDIREESIYSFYLGKRGYVSAEEDARFMLLVGSEEFIDEQEDEIPKLPTQTVLHQNYPNPFNPSTIVRYEIARAGEAVLNIYDVRGSLVKVLCRGYHKPGRYEIGWNGENERGVLVTSGIYFYRLSAGDFVQTKKMVLLR